MVWAFTLGRYHHQVVDDDIALRLERLRLERARFHVLLGLGHLYSQGIKNV